MMNFITDDSKNFNIFIFNYFKQINIFTARLSTNFCS